MELRGLDVLGRLGELDEPLQEVVARLPEEVAGKLASAEALLLVEQRIPVAMTPGSPSEWGLEGPPFFVVEVNSVHRPVLHLSSAVCGEMDLQEIRGMIACAIAALWMNVAYTHVAGPQDLAEEWGFVEEVRDFLKYKFGL